MHTNNTSHYNLPQFIGSDIPNPLTDWNDSMQDIDTAMYEIKTQADEIGSDIVEDESDISDLQSQANLTDDNITLLNQQTTAARAAATDAQDAANRNTANITTLQQSVTNNRTSITQYNNRFNQNVPFAFGIVEEEDPDNPGTMIERYGFYTNDDPSEFVPFGEAGSNELISDIFRVYENMQPHIINDIKPNSPIIIYEIRTNQSISSWSINYTNINDAISDYGNLDNYYRYKKTTAIATDDNITATYGSIGSNADCIVIIMGIKGV